MKVTPTKIKSTITMKTTDSKSKTQAFAWWKTKDDRDLCGQLIATAAFLKESQNFRFRQAAVYARLYGNMSLYSFAGATSAKIDQSTGLPADRPTFNIIQSATDTLVSRIGQSRCSSPTIATTRNVDARNN